MNVGISTACFYPYVNTEDTLEIIKELGFDLCEVFIEADSEMDERFCHALRDKAEKLGIGIYSIHAFNGPFEPFLFDRYERRRREMEQKFIKVCEAARILGAGYYTFHGASGNISAESNDKLVGRIGELCQIARDHGIQLSQENVSWCRSRDPEYLRLLKNSLGSDLRFTLDIKQSVRSMKTPLEILHIYNDRISTVHINDASESDSCLLPGYGGINLREIIREVSVVDRDIPYIIEVYCENFSKYEELAEAKEHLLRLAE